METLNRQQARASGPEGGITLVIAGAGTGKTKTMIQKINNVIGRGDLKPENILVLTFSRKAADEIKRRVASSMGLPARNLTSGTFHSFCLSLLRDNWIYFRDEFGSEHFPSVLDEEGHRNLLRNIVADSLDDFLGIPAGVVLTLMSDLEKLDKKTIKKLNGLGIIEKLDSIKNIYKEHKRKINCIDFEDMIEHAIEKLASSDSLRDGLMNKYKFIFVDEFQDTSPNNIQLLKLIMPADSPNLFVVGDDWQSIYGFRDSRIEYIVRMKRFFPGTKVLKLNTNYRSRKEIVAISNRLIAKNRFRTRKKLRSHKGRGGVVRGYYVKDFDEEMCRINEIVRSEIEHVPEIVILYRNNWQGRLIAQSSDMIRSCVSAGTLALMTMHSSKGLEFHTVIITGISDDIIPDGYSDIEEERRLLYVALTRAGERLHIIYYKGKKDKISLFARELGFKPETE